VPRSHLASGFSFGAQLGEGMKGSRSCPGGKNKYANQNFLIETV